MSYYAIKRPGGKRRTFALQEVQNGLRSTLALEAVAAVNRAYLAGQIPLSEAHKQVEAIRDGLYAERDRHTPQTVFASENVKLLDDYWTSQYLDRDLVDAATMRDDLKRAIGACGVLSLRAATRQELQAHVNARYAASPNRQRRVVSRLNQLLRFAGRDFTLRKVKPLREDPRYLTWGELELVLPHLPSESFRLLARVAWVTGCRLGEIFGLTPTSLKANFLLVSSQIDEAGNRRDTKTRTERKATVLRANQGRIWVLGWATREPEVLKDGDTSLRNVRHSTIFKRACRKAFPKTPAKHCRFHDLRHSYAISMLVKGVPIGLVAKALGNSVGVCERHYGGFSQQDEGLETIDRILAGS